MTRQSCAMRLAAAALVCVATAGAAPPTCAAGACQRDTEEASLIQVRSGIAAHQASLQVSLEDDAHRVLRYKQLGPLRSDDFAECRMESSDCSLKSLKGPTLVFPGGEDAVCMSGEAYRFAVIPGDADKLLFLFPGGGACWQGLVPVLQCSQDISTAMGHLHYGEGILNSTDMRNPFHGWTVVAVLFCSGDAAEAGNGTITKDGVTYPHRGYVNTMTVKAWALANFGNKLKQFTVGGWSAGVVGAMAWANDLLSSFRYDKAVVLLDSLIQVTPPGTQVLIVKRWGVCSTPVLPSELRVKCEAEENVDPIHDFYLSTMQQFPHVAFANLQSKDDETEIWFYNAIARSFGISGISGPGFYAAVKKLFARWTKAVQNFQFFVVDGQQHGFLNQASFYTEGQVSMRKWVSRLLV